MNDGDVLLALKALADADRETKAPPYVESQLRAAYAAKFNNKKVVPIRVWPRRVAWIAAAAAIIVVALAMRPRQQASQVAHDVPKVQQPAPVIADFGTVPVQTVAQTPRRIARPFAGARPRPTEVVTDFFPLVDLAPPLDRASLVRVNLPASAMRTVGLPVREDRLFDRVNADVLVSEEGVATAIRFVKYQ
jgi:hypothetical protein